MEKTPTILLTNDDGIDASGLEALRKSLAELGTVRIVAPKSNMSGAGRSISLGRTEDPIGKVAIETSEKDSRYSFRIPYTEHEHGYVINGTPCECVICGLHALEISPDIVISGCNPGPNTGQHTISRSGTVSAVMEAAMLGTPGIAVSMDAIGQDTLDINDYHRAGRFTDALIRQSIKQNVFDDVDYLNVSLPAPSEPIRGVEVTRPSLTYRMDACHEEGAFRIHSIDRNLSDVEEAETNVIDRDAVRRGRVAISPLTLPIQPTQTAAIESVASTLSERFVSLQSSDGS